jgi:hypothetical protein
MEKKMENLSVKQLDCFVYLCEYLFEGNGPLGLIDFEMVVEDHSARTVRELYALGLITYWDTDQKPTEDWDKVRNMPNGGFLGISPRGVDAFVCGNSSSARYGVRVGFQSPEKGVPALPAEVVWYGSCAEAFEAATRAEGVVGPINEVAVILENDGETSVLFDL